MKQRDAEWDPITLAIRPLGHQLSAVLRSSDIQAWGRTLSRNRSLRSIKAPVLLWDRYTDSEKCMMMVLQCAVSTHKKSKSLTNFSFFPVSLIGDRRLP